MSTLSATDRTRLKRAPGRGSHDRETLDAILDEGLICHVGFVQEGYPSVIPTIHWRQGDRLYLHGSAASRIFRGAKDEGIDLCVTVTLLDGLVLARSAFHHSMNYRSVMVYGRATLVLDEEEKAEALAALVDHVIPGRSLATRAASPRELKQTGVVVMPIEEASAKIRSGGANDEPEDMETAHWAGVLPLRIAAGEPVANADLDAGIATPEHVLRYTRPGWPEVQ